MDGGHHALLGLLDLSAACDTVDHGILTERLSRTYGICSSARDWISPYLRGRRHGVMFEGGRSFVRKLSHGVPQVSVVGPLLFLLHPADLGGLASKLGLSSHFCADDTQLYTTGPRSESVILQRRMELGVDELAGWMRSNRLLLNPSKTDFLWCATLRRCNQLSTVPLDGCGVRVPPTGKVRELGILFEADMQRTGHLRQLVSRCFRQLRLIKSCIRSLPFEAAKTAVACFLITHVDRSNWSARYS